MIEEDGRRLSSKPNKVADLTEGSSAICLLV